METITQQNIIENKKPRMYVSWRIVLLDSVIIILTLLVIREISLIIDPRPRGAVAMLLFTAPFILVQFIVFLIMSVTSIFEKPIGYVSTKGINFLLLSPILVGGLVFLWMTPYQYCGVLTSGPACSSDFFVYLTRLTVFSAPFLSLFVSGILAFYINKRFQKPETDLVIMQS